MNTRHQRTLVGILFVAAMTLVAAFIAVPEVFRIILGISMVFFIPGLAIMHAAFPSKELAPTERLLASLGISLGATVCTAVLLAALPVGLTRDSISITLAGSTIIVSSYAWFRMRFTATRKRNLDVRPKVSYARSERKITHGRLQRFCGDLRLY
jgi:uncharacterized membrane protein